MTEPIWTEAEAQARARDLLASFDRDPDVLSPDEQALAMTIRALERAFAHWQTSHVSSPNPAPAATSLP